MGSQEKVEILVPTSISNIALDINRNGSDLDSGFMAVDPTDLDQVVELGYNSEVEQIKEKEYPYLNNSTYLDHSGATLYPVSLIDANAEALKTLLLGNPHSGSPSSQASTKIVDRVRQQVLQNVFNADPAHFDVVFCANTTAAVKLVADAFSGGGSNGNGPWKPGFVYRFHRDCHTSLVGVRELVGKRDGGAWHCFETNEEVEQWLGPSGPSSARRQKMAKKYQQMDKCKESEKDSQRLKLFAYPAQSNLTGERHPLAWSKRARNAHGYYTLLDAAALLMTKTLDLSDVDSAPDFVVCSWYKVFGMPDLGSLIIKKSSLNAIDIWRRRKFFGGGTISSLSAFLSYRKLNLDRSGTEAPNPLPVSGGIATSEVKFHESLEDGTLPFHSILTLGIAIQNHIRLFGSLQSPTISLHCAALAYFLFTRLSSLTHSSGVKLVKFYPRDSPQYLHPTAQGPVLAFNLISRSGRYISFNKVEKLASAKGINIRVGGNCNPGGVQFHCGWTRSSFGRLFREFGKECGDDVSVVRALSEGRWVERPVGLIRVSLGAITTLEDVVTLWEFIEREFIDYEVHEEETSGTVHGIAAESMFSLNNLPETSHSSNLSYWLCGISLRKRSLFGWF